MWITRGALSRSAFDTWRFHMSGRLDHVIVDADEDAGRSCPWSGFPEIASVASSLRRDPLSGPRAPLAPSHSSGSRRSAPASGHDSLHLSPRSIPLRRPPPARLAASPLHVDSAASSRLRAPSAASPYAALVPDHFELSRRPRGTATGARRRGPLHGREHRRRRPARRRLRRPAPGPGHRRRVAAPSGKDVRSIQAVVFAPSRSHRRDHGVGDRPDARLGVPSRAAP